MRLTTPILLAAGLVACGGNSTHSGSPDAAIDTTAPIDSPQEGSTTLTIQTSRASGPVNTQLIAVQDGDGPWTALTGTAGVYTATLHADRYGVLMSCYTTYGGGPSIFYAAVSDGTTLYFADCDDPGAAIATVSGTVTGAAVADPMTVSDAYFGTADIAAGMTTYSLETYAGPQRLIAEELVGTRPVKIAMVDGTVADGATVNFDLAAGFAPVTQALTVTGANAASLSYRNEHGISDIDHPPSPYTTFRAIPAAKLGTGLNRLSVFDSNGNGVIRYFKDPADQHVTLPAAIHLAQQPTATASPYPNVHFVAPVQADSIYDFFYSTTNTTAMLAHQWSIEMMPAWIAKKFPGGASIDYTAPDFSALAGWRTEFQLEPGLPIDWSVGPSKNTNVDWYVTVQVGTMFDHDGSELVFSSQSGELAAP